MESFPYDEPSGEIRAVSARVLYDGGIAVMLSVPGEDEPVEATFDGDQHTLFMTWDESRPIDLAGTKGADRYCQELVARNVACLNRDLAQRRRAQERRRRELMGREAEHVGG